MADTITRMSPLAGWAAAFQALPASISIAELPFLTQLNLRVDPDGAAAAAVGKVLGGPLPSLPCTASRFGELDVLWLGPDEWLIITVPDQQGQLEARLRAAIGEHPGGVVDVSAQRTAVTLAGPAARDVLARGCAIDLHRRTAPAGTCVQTLLALAGVTIVVRDDSASDFLLLVRASFADYLAAWLVDACRELSR